jgi:hypothetical protein
MRGPRRRQRFRPSYHGLAIGGPEELSTYTASAGATRVVPNGVDLEIAGAAATRHSSGSMTPYVPRTEPSCASPPPLVMPRALALHTDRPHRSSPGSCWLEDELPCSPALVGRPRRALAAATLRWARSTWADLFKF